MISETYSKKIDSCIKALNLLKINRASILQKHENIQMPDSDILKKDLFNSVLDKNLNGKQITYMNSKCKLVRFRDGRDSYEYGIDLIQAGYLKMGF